MEQEIQNEEIQNEEIQNIELAFLTKDDYEELKLAMQKSYNLMQDTYWKEFQIQTLLKKFPEGQVVVKVNGAIAGCALSIIIDYDKFEDFHTYKQITGNYTFNTHSPCRRCRYPARCTGSTWVRRASRPRSRTRTAARR